MDKRKFLYHGDRNRVEFLAPKQGVGFGGPADCQKAVYAVAVREWAIPFAMSFVPTAPDAAFSVDITSRSPRIRLKNTQVMWQQVGYLYTLPADTFEQADEQQWVSYSPVVPLQVEEVNPLDFKEWIEFEGSWGS